jgi:sarcosine oxidase
VTWEVVVVGLGGMGSAAAWHLARRGHRVLGVDQYEPGHTRGASHGRTRIIRKAYFEDPAYVPLLERAYELWDELSRTRGEVLLWRTGGLLLGRPEAPALAGALRSARAFGIPHELLSEGEVRRRFPALSPPPGTVGLLEPDAGVLRPERCVQAHLRAAEAAGACLRFGHPVLRWQEVGSRVVVETAGARVEAGALILTAGPWAPRLLAEAELPLRVTRQVVGWFARPSGIRESLGPWFLADMEDTILYGIPDPEEDTLKAALHVPGEPCTPETVRREVSAEDTDSILRPLRRLVPGLGALRETGTCLYTMTPDGHFVIGRPPGCGRVVYAAGLSGHGFKFAPVIGEILADLATRGTSPHPIAFLSPERFAASRGAARA